MDYRIIERLHNLYYGTFAQCMRLYREGEEEASNRARGFCEGLEEALVAFGHATPKELEEAREEVYAQHNRIVKGE